jgi:hypothetical protein
MAKLLLIRILQSCRLGGNLAIPEIFGFAVLLGR